MRNTFYSVFIVAALQSLVLQPRGLRGCSCQLEGDQIGGRAHDSETAENRITFLIDRGECTGSQSSSSFIRLLQMLRCGWQLDGRCMHYQPSISPDRLHFQVDQSSLFYPPLFTFSPLQPVMYL